MKECQPCDEPFQTNIILLAILSCFLLIPTRRRVQHLGDQPCKDKATALNPINSRDTNQSEALPQGHISQSSSGDCCISLPLRRPSGISYSPGSGAPRPITADGSATAGPSTTQGRPETLLLRRMVVITVEDTETWHTDGSMTVTSKCVRAWPCPILIGYGR